MGLAIHEFNGMTNWKEDGYSQNLIYGVQDFCRWAFLQIGAFVNVGTGSPSGIYGGHPATLHLASDPNFTSGQVWEANRSDWVWETGVGPTGSVQPFRATGVYVGSTFYPTASTTGTYAHHINYPLGRIVFNTAIPTTSVVRANYAYRAVSVIQANAPWFTELLYGTMNPAGSGSHLLAQARRQMPAVGLELVNRRGYKPYQIGGGQHVFQDILYYVLAENKPDRDQICDILANQNDKVIYLADRALIKSSGSYPIDLDYRGMTVASPMQYPQIVAPISESGFQWTRVQFQDTTSQSMQTLYGWLYRGVVRTTVEAIFENI